MQKGKSSKYKFNLIIFGQCPSLSSLCYELISSAERERERERENKQSAHGRSTQCTNNSDPVTSTSELLLRQNRVIAHAHQSWARRLASDHCATQSHRSKHAVRPITPSHTNMKLELLYKEKIKGV
jgi:hypothetical protein